MKKIIPIFIISLLIFSGCGATAIQPNTSGGKTMATKNNATSVQFSSQPRILEREEFVNIELNGMTSQLMEPNKPVLPIFIKTYQLPFGSKSITVTCTPKDINTITLTKNIRPNRPIIKNESNHNIDKRYVSIQQYRILSKQLVQM
jgi:PBP1b-binding outer membrane lipoprotein LpoB